MTHPFLYEINTRCWLRTLSEEQGRPVTLATVPETEFQQWLKLGFTHIWLMGVWTTGPRSRSHALHDPQLRKRYSEILPGWHEQDVPGSPYAIADYEVPTTLGGEGELKSFRERLNKHGLKLILDFVPNHVGLDYPWITAWPELLIHSSQKQSGTFQQKTLRGTLWLAHGKDPHFSPWTDTAQLDYRLTSTRTAMIQLLKSIANKCDGVRCDMAMLLLNDVFAKTWAHFPSAEAMPKEEFWSLAIATIKQEHPEFLFLAEAYWDRQAQLQSLGFDYTYDKHVYDCLVEHRYADLQKHLLEVTPEYLAKSVHFLENHDERRIASVLSLAEHRAAALLILGLPGMRFVYEGQLTGALIHTPVQLGRCRKKKINPDIEAMYQELLAALKATAIGNGEGKVLHPLAAWPENPTAQNFIIIQWQRLPNEFNLVVVNLASHRSQCRVHLDLAGLTQHDWQMRDLLDREVYLRHGGELAQEGLFLDLPEHGAQLFQCLLG
ncbi:MAG: alpha amylase catalytic region [Pedosphaera sp.]|nr:alpha amylase catalytic region [Pedosphaera sp.]